MIDIIRSQRAILTIVGFCALSFGVMPQARAQDAQPGAHIEGELIVKLKGSATSMSSSAFMGKARAQGHMRLKRSWSGINTHHFVFNNEADAQAQMAALKADPAVEYAEPNYIISVSNTETSGPAMKATAEGNGASSNDASSCALYNGQTTSGINITGAWGKVSNTSYHPIVAIVDSGIALTHPTFTQSNALWTNPGETGGGKETNGVDDDHNGYIDDVHGWNFISNSNSPQDDYEHGTHVAGIVLGTTEDIITPARNSSTPIGQAAIRLMPLKFLDSTGQGTTANGITAIYYAVNNGAKVINASWGGSSFSNGLLEAIAFAYSHGVTVVTAAGNNYANNDSSPTYPANYGVPSQLSVAASVDSDDSLAYFSNYGSTTVHVAGPGYYILSTLPNVDTNITNSTNYGCMSGTSMATPFVAGIAALIYHESPTMNGYQVRNLIMSTVDSRSVLNQKVATTGRVDANTAIVQAKTAVVASSQPDYNAASYERSTASEAAGGGCGRVQAFDQTSGTGKSLEFFALLAVLALPILVNRYVRSRHADEDGKNRRRHERFNITSEVHMNVGGRELKGSISTISLGGVQLNADALLEQGGIVTMMISSPDGKEQIKVEGQVVWSAESKAYGVQFAKAEDGALASISQWTKNLTKAS